MINSVHAYSSTFFGTGIRMYALCILLGIIIAYIQGVREGKKLGLSTSFIFYGVVIIVPIAIVGARLWYVLFNLDKFSDFGEVLGFNNGRFTGFSGLAIQGGVIAALIAIYVYCKVKKVSLYKVLDIVAPGFLIGQILGRYGNFFNRELYGAIVSNSSLIRYIIPSVIMDNMYIEGGFRHPVFFYESTLNLLGLIIMLVLRNKSKKIKSGDFIGIYLCWYGAVRILTESLRSQSGANEILMLGPIPVSILVSVIFIIAGITYLILKRKIAAMNGNQLYYQIKEEVAAKAIDTVIFDLDGTLLDTKPLIDQTFLYTFEHFYPNLNITQEDLNSFFGPTLHESFSKYCDDEDKINEMIEYYRVWNKEHHNEYVKAYPYAKETMRRLHKKGYKVAVVSSKIKEMVEYGLDSNQMLDSVDYIIGEGEILPKPNPEGILLAMDHFKFSKNAIYIGDNPSDIYAAKNADKYYKDNNINKSVKSCGVLYSYKLDLLEQSEPDYYIKDMEALLDLLGI